MFKDIFVLCWVLWNTSLHNKQPHYGRTPKEGRKETTQGNMLFRLLQGTNFLTFKLHSVLLNYIPLLWYGSSQATKMPLSKAYCSRGMWSCRTLHFLHCSDARCWLYSKPANAVLHASECQTRSLNFLIVFTWFPSLFTELTQMKSSCRAFDTRAGTECRF